MTGRPLLAGPGPIAGQGEPPSRGGVLHAPPRARRRQDEAPGGGPHHTLDRAALRVPTARTGLARTTREFPCPPLPLLPPDGRQAQGAGGGAKGLARRPGRSLSRALAPARPRAANPAAPPGPRRQERLPEPPPGVACRSRCRGRRLPAGPLAGPGRGGPDPGPWPRSAPPPLCGPGRWQRVELAGAEHARAPRDPRGPGAAELRGGVPALGAPPPRAGGQGGGHTGPDCAG